MTSPAGSFVVAIDAVVAPEREDELVARYRALTAAERPDGLLRTELLRGQDGSWRFQSLWRDRDALVALRKAGRPTAAAELFGSVGARPVADMYTLVESSG